MASKSNGNILRYPLSIGASKAPAILFNIHKARYNNEGTGVIATTESHIALYMTKALSFKDSIKYEERSSGAVGSVKDANFSITDMLKSSKDAAVAMASSDIGKGAITGLVTKVTGLGGGAAALAVSGLADEELKETQKVLRANPFMTFKGVGLRSWSFNWVFVPESEKESKVAKAIILQFRKAMYPEKETVLLKFPDVFNIEFVNAVFPKMPEVALSSCSVTYNENSNSFFLQNNEPVSIKLSLTFQELMPLYNSHIHQGY